MSLLLPCVLPASFLKFKADDGLQTGEQRRLHPTSISSQPCCATYSGMSSRISVVSPLPVLPLRYESPAILATVYSHRTDRTGGSFPCPQGIEGEQRQGLPEHASGLLVDYTEAAFESTVDQLSVLLGKQDITYDLLWALFTPNTEVYTTCQGTGAPRCVLHNRCEEKTDIDGSKYMYVEGRYRGRC